MILLVLVATIGLCSPPAPHAAPDKSAASQERTPVTETIEETTVGDIDGVRVPMANMTRGSYTLPDGTEKEGLICALVLPDGPVFVGEGSVVEISGGRWEVTGIRKPAGELGSVTLTKR